EITVFQGVILDMDGKPLVAGNQARPPGYRPALQGTVHVQAQVVMQPARIVLLDQVGIPSARLALFAAWFGRCAEVAFLAVGGESHQLALRRCAGSFRLSPRAFRGGPAASALRRSASMRLATFGSLGAFGGFISRPSAFALTSSASARS